MKLNNKETDRLRILLLDESAPAAENTEAMLRRVRDCDIETVDSVSAALDKVSRQPPDLILTEWKLVDHSAAELLQSLKSNSDWRDIPVLVCTFFRRKEMMIRVKELGALGVLTKPVDEKTLKRYIDQLFPLKKPAKQEMMAEATQVIHSHIKHIETLAPLPALAKKVIEISNDPNSTAMDMSRVIRKDTSLSVRLLKIVNSAFFNFYRKISDVSRAIVILGVQEVKNISLGACLMQHYPSRKSPHFDRNAYWRHAFGTAYIAQSLHKLCQGLAPEDAFTMGLLHDFGKVVLDQHFGNVFDIIIQIAERKKQPLHWVEKELIDIDHPTIGGMVAENWKLPISLVSAIRYHHEPFEDLKYNYGNLIHLCNYFCHKQKIGASGNPAPDEPYPGSLIALGLEGRDLEDVWNSTGIDAKALSRIM